jgi:hypothetical protein
MELRPGVDGLAGEPRRAALLALPVGPYVNIAQPRRIMSTGLRHWAHEF